jgi:chemotaxis protein methyltransferase CheR
MQPELLTPAPREFVLSRADLDRFRHLVRETCGLLIPEARRGDLERVIAQTLVGSELQSVADLYMHLKQRTGRRTLEAFLGALTVGETHFFRNRPQFEALEYHLLPELIEKRRSTRRLRIWSAGCSSGEEAYSAAMLLRTLLPDIAEWSITILATDINPEALDRAERATYGPWSFREVPPSMKARYFKARGDTFEVVDEIRALVTFRYLNLVSDSYPSLPTNTLGMDLILCRNVLIYFDDDTVDHVVGRLHSALLEEGNLVVAPAEFSQARFRTFQTLNFPGTVIYKKPAPAPENAPAPTEASGGIVSVTPYLVPHRPPATVIENAAALQPPPAQIMQEILYPSLDPDCTEDENGEAAYATAKELAGRLELERAFDYVSLAIEREPLFARAHHLKGLILIELNRLDEALNALRACVFADSSFALGHYTLAGVLTQMKQEVRARRCLDRAAGLLRELDPDAELEDGEGLTAGRLLEMIDVQRTLLDGAIR